LKEYTIRLFTPDISPKFLRVINGKYKGRFFQVDFDAKSGGHTKPKQLTKNQFGNLSPENLSKAFGQMVDHGISTLFSQTLEGSFSAMRKTLRQIFSDFALSKNEILLELSRFIITQPLERTIRAFYLKIIAQVDFQALDSTADEIQIMDLLIQMAMIGKEVLASR